MLTNLLYQIRWVLPLWFVGLLTDWLPTNRYTIRLRGLLATPFVGHVGRNFQLGPNVHILSSHNLRIGNHVYIATGCWLNCLGGLTIEDEVLLAPYVVISTLQHGFVDGSVRFGGSIAAPVTIGKGSWLAAHVCVKCGVKIGKGNVVGANSCVVKDTPDRKVIGGVPGRVIGDTSNKPGNGYTRAQFMTPELTDGKTLSD